jgi:two-component sensor histidine kinase
LPETISLLFDGEGGLWQGTNGGLNYYDIENWYKTGKMDKVHYALQDYGKGLEFNGAAALVDEEGNLWFGTASKGLLKYNYSSTPTSMLDRAPLTFIRRIFANGKKVYDQKTAVEDFQGIHLGYDQNNIEIEYGAVNYKNPLRIFYRYKLSGFEEEWNTAIDKREAVYTNLNPGNYTFSVMSKSTTSEWGEQASMISINIAKPFWTTWWFIFLVFSTIGGLIFFYIKSYMHILEKRRLKELVDEQTADLQAALLEKEVLIKEIHHRVKNNMAVVSGLLDLQSWQLADGTAKSAIENSKLRIKTMSSIHEKLYQSDNFNNVNIQSFVKDLVSNISNSLKAQGKVIKVHQDIEVKQMDVNKAIPSGLLLNEMISNSFEHAFPDQNEGNVRVTFKENKTDYVLIVQDDGIGMPDGILERTRSSLGLTLIKSLTEQIYGTLSIKNENGSLIKITIPK